MTLHHADCLAVLPTLDPAKIALVLTDPPYGLSVRLRNQSTTQPATRIANDEDQSVALAVLAWAERHRLPTVAFASPKRPWPGRWKSYLVWDKGGAVGMGDLRRSWKPTWELIQVRDNTPLRGKRDQAVLRHAITNRDLRDHPTAKPVPLLAYLIRQLTDPGDVVFDPFMGIGSTGLACREAGRGFIGVEMDAGYYARACERLAR